INVDLNTVRDISATTHETNVPEPRSDASKIHEKTIPQTLRTLIVDLKILCLQTIIIAKQPDFGNSNLISASPNNVIILAG
ncbi:hypothetical protein NPN26_25450, partial [Vibrio parahaemolyticus]|nr:hypothetical protein [Vibrio parahaemolyticus]